MPRDPQWRTGVWHGDLPLALNFPVDWDVTFLWPKTPAPLTDDQLAAIVSRPAAHPPLRQLAQGKKRPVVIVDDPNRATPVARVMPLVLAQLREASIPAGDVRIVVAVGTHGTAHNATIEQKLGLETVSQCQVIMHDSTARDLVNIGTTTFGTPVLVNSEVVNSDLVLGIGGIYPNHTAGFGGGTKLALGVLGFESIKHLHYRHQSLGWGSAETGTTFRQDLGEIAKAVSLGTMISTHVNAERQIVRMVYGDPARYFDDEVEYSRQTFGAPMPGDADVVVCNTYPNDLSLTFALMKGTAPHYHCRPTASRIAVAFCGEGVGHHGLFPLYRSRFHRPRHIARRMRLMSIEDLTRKVGNKLRHGFAGGEHTSQASQNPVWLYRPGTHSEALPPQVRDVRTTTLWSEVIQAVRREQPAGKRLKVAVYPCAPLQCLEPAEFKSFAPQTIPVLEKKSA